MTSNWGDSETVPIPYSCFTWRCITWKYIIIFSLVSERRNETKKTTQIYMNFSIFHCQTYIVKHQIRFVLSAKFRGLPKLTQVRLDNVSIIEVFQWIKKNIYKRNFNRYQSSILHNLKFVFNTTQHRFYCSVLRHRIMWQIQVKVYLGHNAIRIRKRVP